MRRCSCSVACTGRCLASADDAKCECDTSGLVEKDLLRMNAQDCSWHKFHYQTNIFDARCPNAQDHQPQIPCDQRGGATRCTTTVGECVLNTDFKREESGKSGATAAPKKVKHGWVLDGVEAAKLPLKVAKSTGGSGHDKAVDGAPFSRHVERTASSIPISSRRMHQHTISASLNPRWCPQVGGERGVFA